MASRAWPIRPAALRRGQRKAHRHAIELLFPGTVTRGMNERPQALKTRPWELRQTIFHEDAILAGQRDHIGDGPQCRQGREFHQQCAIRLVYFFGIAQLLRERPRRA